MALPPVVALEIGTSKVVALVGELREDGHIVIIGMGEHLSAGVRKGEVTDYNNALTCVKGALAGAEETAQVAIHQVHLAISGAHIQSLVNRGNIPIQHSAEGISVDDVEQVTAVARAVNLPSEREILHSVGQIFYVDGERVGNPVGFECATLALDMLVLHAKSNHIRNSVKLLREIPMEVTDVAFGGLCSALAVLTPEQKEGGALVIDLGGGTTTYVAYAAGIFAAAGALGLGGDHVTNDIALAFNIPRTQANRLKCESGSVLAEDAARGQRVTLPPEVGYPGRSVSLAGLNNVMHVRMAETLQIILRDIERLGIQHQIGAGVVLTGGGAHMKGLIKLAERIFRVPCMVGRPMGFSGLTAVTERPEYASAAGLIRYAFKDAKAARGARSVLRRIQDLFAGR
ncbi:MAG: cell division protein FtsA [bacterium]|jgi:cell division protein FtsA